MPSTSRDVAAAAERADGRWRGAGAARNVAFGARLIRCVAHLVHVLDIMCNACVRTSMRCTTCPDAGRHVQRILARGRPKRRRRAGSAGRVGGPRRRAASDGPRRRAGSAGRDGAPHRTGHIGVSRVRVTRGRARPRASWREGTFGRGRAAASHARARRNVDGRPQPVRAPDAPASARARKARAAWMSTTRGPSPEPATSR